MNALSNFYEMLPGGRQPEFREKITIACYWNDDQFYKKKNGSTKIRPLEKEKILEVAKEFSTISDTQANLFEELEGELSTLV